MSQNKVKQEQEPIKHKPGKILSGLMSVFNGSFLAKRKVLMQYPFMLYLTFLGIIYIANAYQTEKTVVAIDNIKKELKEIRHEYIATKSSLMHHSRQSEIAKKISGLGLKESTVPPFKIGRNE